jgi:hypothetical protein
MCDVLAFEHENSGVVERHISPYLLLRGSGENSCTNQIFPLTAASDGKFYMLPPKQNTPCDRKGIIFTRCQKQKNASGGKFEHPIFFM